MNLVDNLKSGVTIASILDEFGIRYRHRRCACPIHGGDNKTAFSFTDTHFKCHTRGCSGDTLTLIMALQHTDFYGACQYLAQRKRMTLSESPLRRHPRKSSPSTFAIPQMLEGNPELEKSRRRLCTVRSLITYWTRRLRDLQDRRRLKLIAGCDYYSRLHVADWHLAQLDAEDTSLNYAISHHK